MALLQNLMICLPNALLMTNTSEAERVHPSWISQPLNSQVSIERGSLNDW